MDAVGIAQVVTGFMSVGAMGAIWFDIRSIKTKVVNKIEAVEKDHNACKLALPEKYGAKSSLDDLWKRTDGHSEKLSYMEGQRNGK